MARIRGTLEQLGKQTGLSKPVLKHILRIAERQSKAKRVGYEVSIYHTKNKTGQHVPIIWEVDQPLTIILKA